MNGGAESDNGYLCFWSNIGVNVAGYEIGSGSRVNDGNFFDLIIGEFTIELFGAESEDVGKTYNEVKPKIS